MLLELASGLDRNRFRSIAFLPDGSWLPFQLRARGVSLIISKATTWPGLIRQMREVVLSESVDLIQSHLDDQNCYSSITGKLTGRTTIVTYHGAPGLARQQGYRRAIKSWIPKRFASEIVVVSEYLRRIFLEAGFPEVRTHRIYNGVDLARFAGGETGHLRRELGLRGDVRLVGTVANLRRSKGYNYLVESCRAVADAVPHTAFVAVGETEKDLLRRLEDQIQQLGLKQRFFFLGFRADVPQILRELDVFVLASTDEGFSIATIEAMAASRPVVATLSGGPQEIIRDTETGFLVPPRDSSALAARIIEILQDSRLEARLGRAARIDVERRFSPPQMISAYEALYLKRLEGK